MVRLAGLESDDGAAAARVSAALESGRALERFTRLLACHGGDPRVADDPSRLPSAPDRTCVRAPRGGCLQQLRAGLVGRAAHALGAGRSRAGDPVDHGVGILLRAGPGDDVRTGDPVLELCHRHGRGLDAAVALCEAALVIGDEPVPARSRILQVLR
jgi:thymidine phosphorylase